MLLFYMMAVPGTFARPNFWMPALPDLVLRVRGARPATLAHPILCALKNCIGAVNLARAIGPMDKPPVYIATALYHWCCYLRPDL